MEAATELKQENRDIRDHFDHYQEKAAEDRQQERDQHRASSQLLQDQMQELKGRLTQAEATTSQLLDTNSQLQRSVDELTQDNATLKDVMNRKSEEIESLNRHLEVALTKSQKYREQKTQLAEQIATLVRQKTDIDKGLALLSQALETTRADLIAAHDKIAFLADENKVVLQEKAVIQGQFKQLQSALEKLESYFDFQNSRSFRLNRPGRCVGCFLPYLWLRKDGSIWLLIPAAISLCLFVWLLTLHRLPVGESMLPYGVYVATTLAWLRVVDGIKLTIWD